MLRVTCAERVCECAATVADATPCKEVAANGSPTHPLAPALLPMTDEAHVSPVPSQDAVARVASNQVRSHARGKTTCHYSLPLAGDGTGTLVQRYPLMHVLEHDQSSGSGKHGASHNVVAQAIRNDWSPDECVGDECRWCKWCRAMTRMIGTQRRRRRRCLAVLWRRTGANAVRVAVRATRPCGATGPWAPRCCATRAASGTCPPPSNVGLACRMHVLRMPLTRTRTPRWTQGKLYPEQIAQNGPRAQPATQWSLQAQQTAAAPRASHPHKTTTKRESKPVAVASRTSRRNSDSSLESRGSISSPACGAHAAASGAGGSRKRPRPTAYIGGDACAAPSPRALSPDDGSPLGIVWGATAPASAIARRALPKVRRLDTPLSRP
jgi:hypothetical protein